MTYSSTKMMTFESAKCNLYISFPNLDNINGYHVRPTSMVQGLIIVMRFLIHYCLEK